MVDRPEAASPRRIICREGTERFEETESRMEDHKSSGGCSGLVIVCDEQKLTYVLGSFVYGLFECVRTCINKDDLVHHCS